MLAYPDHSPSVNLTLWQNASSIDHQRFSIEDEKKLVRKQDLRLIPLAAFIYLLCYLDRSNIGE